MTSRILNTYVDIHQENIKKNNTSLYYELLAGIYCLDTFLLFICNKKKITITTNCEAIIWYNQQTKGTKKGLSVKRWIKFANSILNKGLKLTWEHIKEIDNSSLADVLSRLAY